jgi:hypothetical protein
MLSRLVVDPGSAADLGRRDPRDTLGLPGKDEAKEQLATLLEELSSLQERLYAEGSRASSSSSRALTPPARTGRSDTSSAASTHRAAA